MATFLPPVCVLCMMVGGQCMIVGGLCMMVGGLCVGSAQTVSKPLMSLTVTLTMLTAVNVGDFDIKR